MRLVFDAQLPPLVVSWVSRRFGVDAQTLKQAGLAGHGDFEIFTSLRERGNVIVSKDADFASFVRKHNAPPQVLWIRCGNLTNRALIARFEVDLGRALDQLRAGEALVCIDDDTGTRH